MRSIERNNLSYQRTESCQLRQHTVNNYQGLPTELYSSLGTDPDMEELVEMFVDEMPERIAKLCGQYEAGNWSELQRLAHQLKGAAGSYGFDTITPFAARLEGSIRDGRTEVQIREALDDLVDLCRRARARA